MKWKENITCTTSLCLAVTLRSTNPNKGGFLSFPAVTGLKYGFLIWFIKLHSTSPSHLHVSPLGGRQNRGKAGSCCQPSLPCHCHKPKTTRAAAGANIFLHEKKKKHPCSTLFSTPLLKILNIPSGQQISAPSWMQTKATSCVSISPESHWSCKAAAPDLLNFCSSRPVAKLQLLTCSISAVPGLFHCCSSCCKAAAPDLSHFCGS